MSQVMQNLFKFGNFLQLNEDMRYVIYQHLPPSQRVFLDKQMLLILNPAQQFMIPRTFSHDKYELYVMFYIIEGKFEHLLPDLINCAKLLVKDPVDQNPLITLERVEEFRLLSCETMLTKSIKFCEDANLRRFVDVIGAEYRILSKRYPEQVFQIHCEETKDFDSEEALVGIILFCKIYQIYVQECRGEDALQQAIHCLFVSMVGILTNNRIKLTWSTEKIGQMLQSVSEAVASTTARSFYKHSDVREAICAIPDECVYRDKIVDTLMLELLKTDHFGCETRFEFISSLSDPVCDTLLTKEFIMKNSIRHAYYISDGRIEFKETRIDCYADLLQGKMARRKVLKDKDFSMLQEHTKRIYDSVEHDALFGKEIKFRQGIDEFPAQLRRIIRKYAKK